MEQVVEDEGWEWLVSEVGHSWGKEVEEGVLEKLEDVEVEHHN